MISTIDVNNGFRLQLLPMALNGSTFAASGLRSAILALSAFHRYGPKEALPYKTRALGLLSHSLDKETTAEGQTDTQLAASMMMCVYNVSSLLDCLPNDPGAKYTYICICRSLTRRRAIGISTSTALGRCFISTPRRQGAI